MPAFQSDAFQSNAFEGAIDVAVTAGYSIASYTGQLVYASAQFPAQPGYATATATGQQPTRSAGVGALPGAPLYTQSGLQAWAGLGDATPHPGYGYYAAYGQPPAVYTYIRDVIVVVAAATHAATGQPANPGTCYTRPGSGSHMAAGFPPDTEIFPRLRVEIQSLAPGQLVTLFVLDASALGYGIYYFYKGTIDGQRVNFQGHEYTPMPIEAEGFELTARGTLPTPKIRIANALLTMAPVVIAGSDLLGAIVTRVRTFSQYLDGQIAADPTATFPLDIYVIERKTRQDNQWIEWELRSWLDQEGKMIPGRQMIRDTCPWIYRRWSGDSFAYPNSESACPYTGEVFFRLNGTATIRPEEDCCGHRLSDCKLRFPGQWLPFGGFPGAGRYRQ